MIDVVLTKGKPNYDSSTTAANCARVSSQQLYGNRNNKTPGVRISIRAQNE